MIGDARKTREVPQPVGFAALAVCALVAIFVADLVLDSIARWLVTACILVLLVAVLNAILQRRGWTIR